MGARYLYFLWAKLDKKRHSMTQIASLLAVGTGLWTMNMYVLLLGRGAYTQDQTTYMYAGT